MHRTLFTSCLNELHSASQTTVVSPLSCRVIRSISGCSKVNKHAPLFVADETDRFNRYKLEIWETWPRVTAYSTVACAYCYNIFATKTSNSQLRCSHVERLMFASTSKLHAALPWLTKSMNSKFQPKTPACQQYEYSLILSTGIETRRKRNISSPDAVT